MQISLSLVEVRRIFSETKSSAVVKSRDEEQISNTSL